MSIFSSSCCCDSLTRRLSSLATCCCVSSVFASCCDKPLLKFMVLFFCARFVYDVPYFCLSQNLPLSAPRPLCPPYRMRTNKQGLRKLRSGPRGLCPGLTIALRCALARVDPERERCPRDRENARPCSSSTVSLGRFCLFLFRVGGVLGTHGWAGLTVFLYRPTIGLRRFFVFYVVELLWGKSLLPFSQRFLVGQ